MTNDFSGGLRRLRPPATFLQPFGLRWVSQRYYCLCEPRDLREEIWSRGKQQRKEKPRE